MVNYCTIFSFFFQLVIIYTLLSKHILNSSIYDLSAVYFFLLSLSHLYYSCRNSMEAIKMRAPLSPFGQ